MKTIVTLAAAAALFGAGLQGALALDVKYALWAQPGEAQYEGVVEFKRVVEEESDGRYTVTIYPNNQLGTPREMLAQLALGTLEFMGSGDPGIPEIEYLSLPYLMKDLPAYAAVLETDFGQKWNQRLIDQQQVRLFGFMPRSPRQISANVIINSMDDLEGLKIRAPEKDYYIESLAALGANPTPMAFGEVYTGLQTGIVDGQENPIETIYAQKYYEVQKGVAMVDYIYKPAFIMVSEVFWSGLSDEDKALFTKAHDASNAKIEALLPDQEKTFIKEMEAAGVAVTYPDKAPFMEATAGVREGLGKRMWGDEIYAEIVKIGAVDMN